MEALKTKGAMSANEMYRKSGSTLPFRDWLEMTKNRGEVIPNKPALDAYLNMSGPNTSASTPSTDNSALQGNIFRTLLLVGAVFAIYKVWKKNS